MTRFLALVTAALAAVFISGCATDKPSPASQAAAESALINLRSLEASARLEEARAEQAYAAKLDAGGAAAVLLAKHLKAGGGVPQQVQAQPQSLAGMAWQALLQITDLGLRAYGIKANRDVNLAQSNNSRDVALSSNATFAAMGQSIAQAGSAGYPYIQSAQPNITQTLSGTGVLGSGSYTAPVTTTTTTTRNCNGGNAAAGGAGGAGAAGTTSGGAGGLAGSGGSAAGGNC